MTDAEIVRAEGAPLATMETAPVAVIREATAAATALKDVIARKPKPVLMNGEQYLEFEDWQTLGRFYGVTAAGVGEPEFVEPAPGIRGFKATSEALDRTGRVLSRATAYCLNDEEKWRGRTKYEWVYVLADGTTSVEDPGKGRIVWEDNPNKPGGKRPKKQRLAVGEEMVPLYQLASMAQTRANAKALRNVLSWVAVMAGYRPTPAEELPDDRRETRPETPQDEGDKPEPLPVQRARLIAAIERRAGKDQKAQEDLLDRIAGRRTYKGWTEGDFADAWRRLRELDSRPSGADLPQGEDPLGGCLDDPDSPEAEREPEA